MKEVVVKVLNPTYSKDFIGVVTKSDDDSIINKKIFFMTILNIYIPFTSINITSERFVY